MVVLMEYIPGLTMKRKSCEEPVLFSCSVDGDADLAGGVPISCRATKIRRLESPDGYQHGDLLPAVVASDVVMGEAQAPSLSPVTADEERSMVVFDQADAARGERLGLSGPSLFRSGTPLRVAGADWIRDMLREADIRTVREVLSSAQREGADLAVVPWCAAPPAPSSTDQQPSTAAEGRADEEAQGVAVMEVEEEMQGLQTSKPGAAAASSWLEGRLYRWPQHCMATLPLPAVPQASSVMCSW